MTRRLRTLVALLVASVTVVGAVAPAGAETGGRGYERGNAPAAIDITWLHATNADQRFAIQVKVRDLRDRGRFSFHYWAGRKAAPPTRSLLLVVRHVDDGVRARFLTCGREDCAPAPCRSFHATWSPETDVVRVAARQRCFPGRTPSGGRFFAWAETEADVDEGSEPFFLKRG
jgi:hypothetical protein